MTEPILSCPPSRAPLLRRIVVGWAGCALVLGPLGCGFVPRAKLDQCHQLTQTLRAENTNLKDVALDLRAQNQDLSQRAVDDARRIATQDEAIARLEKSVIAYQTERDQLAASFEAIKRQVRLSATPNPTSAAADSITGFVAQQRGWGYDASSSLLTLPVDALFEPGSSTIREEVQPRLAQLGQLLKEGNEILEISLQAGGEAEEIRRTGFGGDASDTIQSPPQRFLLAARAAKVRELLTKQDGLEPDRVRLVAPKHESGLQTRGQGDGDMLLLQLRPRTGGLDAAPAADK